MNKVIVKTTGDFQLMDPQTQALIPVDGNSESIPKTAFIEERLRLGQLELVSEQEVTEPSDEVTLPASTRGEWPEGSPTDDSEELVRLAASDRDMAAETEAMTSKTKVSAKPAEGSGGQKASEGARTGGRTKSDDA